jgi:phospholipid/cholesterol/gamma-HCH transport system permease protein
MAQQTHIEAIQDQPELRCVGLPTEAPVILLKGDWTTLALAPMARDLSEQLLQWAPHPRVSWDLSGVQKLDQAGALLLWRAWGRSLPHELTIPAVLEEYFTRLPQADAAGSQSIARPHLWRRVVMQLGLAALDFVNQLRDIVVLIGQLVLDAADVAKHPGRWPGREISAGVFRGGAQALGILGLVGFLIGVVLSYLSGDQLRRFGAEIYVVNLLGIGCTRELGPLLAAILVAGRSGSSMTAQLGVMRLNEEIDALTTIGIRATQRLILPKVIALALAQPLTGLWTTAVALIGGMIAAHLSLGVGYRYFLDALPEAVPIANYWIGLGKGVVFGMIIAIVACHFGLRVKPNTESLGAGTTSSVVIAISSVLVADALFAVLFSHFGI